MEPKTNKHLFGSVEFFIEQNHAGITPIIKRRLGKQYDQKKMTWAEIRLWVLNDEELYKWAVREGVKEDQ